MEDEYIPVANETTTFERVMSKTLFRILSILVTTIGYFATDIYLPSMPAMTHYFETTNTLVQFTIPAYMLPFGLAPLYFGPLSDKWGRRPVILLGLVLSVLATVCILFANSIWMVLLGRFLQGFTFGAVNVAARAMMTDKFKGHELSRFNSTQTLFVPIVLSLAPPIGGFIQEMWNWRYVFVVLFCYQVIVSLIIAALLEETAERVEQASQSTRAAYLELLKNAPFLLYGAITVIGMMGITVYLTVSPYLFQIYLGMTPVQYGCLSIFVGGCVITSAICNIQLLKRIESHQILHISWVIMLIATLILMYAHFNHIKSVPLIAFGAIFYFFSLNMTFANSVANAFMQIEHNFGAGTALVTSAQMLCAMLASSVVSVLPENDVQILMYTYLLMIMLYVPTLLTANAKNTKIHYIKS